jgi:CheY-like chemotaxis protein
MPRKAVRCHYGILNYLGANCSHRYDLVLMDSEMPVMDGTTAMINIRREHGDNTPYMVVVTAAGESRFAHASMFF